MDWEEPRLYYSHQQLQKQTVDNNNDDDDDAILAAAVNNNNSVEEDTPVDLMAVRRHFREFLRNYQLKTRFLYREKLLRMHRRLGRSNPQTNNNDNTPSNAGGAGVIMNNAAKLDIDLAHIGEYDAALLGFLMNQPAQLLSPLEQAASDALNSLLYDMNNNKNTTNSGNDDEEDNDNHMDDHENENENPNGANRTNTTPNYNNSINFRIQILLTGNLKITNLRSIKSEHMNKLLKCNGIVISSSNVKSRAIQLTVRCPRCLDTQILTATNEGPYASIMLPQTCANNRRLNATNATAAAAGVVGDAAQTAECGSYPYSVVPDESTFMDIQSLKLQETPEKVPTGEIPRSVMLAVERSLVDVAPPGTRVSILCIPTLLNKKSSNNSGSGNDQNSKSVYLRVVGMSKDDVGAHGSGSTGSNSAVTFTPAEEEAFVTLARRSDVYDILSRSMAPSISGTYTVDIKRALICQLMGGSRKRLPDGVKLRGDVNVLLLGDPSTAKSQFLKFVSKVAPVGIYTSGKGSSAAGLTASVVKNAAGEFYLEGGAMVLADGGIVCIDEFDKMRPADRVAIHEAMEQQTISVAKAGITTVLNSRSSVLAAANPVFGRYDDFKSASENIDLMTTILSRFDLIFLVRDIREEERDRMICQHVMGVHINHSSSSGGGGGPGGSGLTLAGGSNPFASAAGGGGMDTEGEGETTTYVTLGFLDRILEGFVDIS